TRSPGTASRWSTTETAAAPAPRRGTGTPRAGPAATAPATCASQERRPGSQILHAVAAVGVEVEVVGAGVRDAGAGAGAVFADGLEGPAGVETFIGVNASKRRKRRVRHADGFHAFFDVERIERHADAVGALGRASARLAFQRVEHATGA